MDKPGATDKPRRAGSTNADANAGTAPDKPPASDRLAATPNGTRDQNEPVRERIGAE